MIMPTHVLSPVPHYYWRLHYAPGSLNMLESAMSNLIAILQIRGKPLYRRRGNSETVTASWGGGLLTLGTLTVSAGILPVLTCAPSATVNA